MLRRALGHESRSSDLCVASLWLVLGIFGWDPRDQSSGTALLRSV